MEIISLILITFVMVGFSVLGIALWAAFYPKTLCQKVYAPEQEQEWNVCVRPRGHKGRCVSVMGKEF